MPRSRLFRPMDELDHEDEVEFSLWSGAVVRGRLLKAATGPRTRTFLYWQPARPEWPVRSGWVICRPSPTGWRELPTPESETAWRELAAA